MIVSSLLTVIAAVWLLDMAQQTEAVGGRHDDNRCAAFVAQLRLLPKGGRHAFGPELSDLRGRAKKNLVFRHNRS